MRTSRSIAGVTLIELVVALAVLAIAAAIVIPGFADTLRSQRLSSRSFAFQEDLAYARAEAVKRQSNVVLSAKSGGLSQGWLVFDDMDADERQDAGEKTLREQGAMSPGYSMKAANGTGNPKLALAFDRRGALSGRGTMGVLICAPNWRTDRDADFARNLHVSANGRAESARGKGNHRGLSCS